MKSSPFDSSFDAGRMRPRQLTCADVFLWPEFQAFLKRLGIPLVETSLFTIEMTGPSNPVVVTHRYHAADASGQTVMPVPSGPVPSGPDTMTKEEEEILRSGSDANPGAQTLKERVAAGPSVKCERCGGKGMIPYEDPSGHMSGMTSCSACYGIGSVLVRKK